MTDQSSRREKPRGSGVFQIQHCRSSWLNLKEHPHENANLTEPSSATPTNPNPGQPRRQIPSSRRQPTIVLALLAVLDAPGCATITRSTTDQLAVESEPTGAQVTLSNSQEGITPASFTLPRKDPLTCRAPPGEMGGIRQRLRRQRPGVPVERGRHRLSLLDPLCPALCQGVAGFVGRRHPVRVSVHDQRLWGVQRVATLQPSA
jgi:hypothetical protein